MTALYAPSALSRATPPLRILVADPDAATREKVVHAARLLGYQHSTAEDGGTAWNLLHRESPDVLVVDARLPPTDARDLACRARAIEGRPYVFVLLVAARDDRASLVEALNAAADAHIARPLDVEELVVRLRAIARLLAVNRGLRRECVVAHAEAHVDSLTGLRNRRAFDEDLANACAIARRYERPFSLALGDVDDFKRYNQTHGHLAGDGALRDVASALKASMRLGDGAYRYGGDELALILPNQLAEGARVAAERARTAVAATRRDDAGRPAITMSIGATAFDPSDTPETCFARADAALLSAKWGRKNRVVTRPRSVDPGRPSAPIYSAGATDDVKGG